MTVQDYAADQTERIGASLAHFVVTTDPVRLGWEVPAEGGGHTRSILDQIGECVGVNVRFAALLRGVASPDAPLAPRTATEAEAQIVSSAGELADAIRGVADDALEDAVQTPRGGVLVKNLMLAAYRNMAYHAGQINFIQVLGGDAEFHDPPNWR